MRDAVLRTILWAGLLALAGCVSAPPPRPDAGPGVVHHLVICWLKEPGNAERRQQLIDASNTFRAIPGVLRVSAGRVLPSERPVVDSSYDVAVEIVLKDAAALERYLRDPRHVQAGREVLTPLTAKVVIYDFTE